MVNHNEMILAMGDLFNLLVEQDLPRFVDHVEGKELTEKYKENKIVILKMLSWMEDRLTEDMIYSQHDDMRLGDHADGQR